jgi:hypothetical protein
LKTNPKGEPRLTATAIHHLWQLVRHSDPHVALHAIAIVLKIPDQPPIQEAESSRQLEIDLSSLSPKEMKIYRRYLQRSRGSLSSVDWSRTVARHLPAIKRTAITRLSQLVTNRDPKVRLRVSALLLQRSIQRGLATAFERTDAEMTKEEFAVIRKILDLTRPPMAGSQPAG